MEKSFWGPSTWCTIHTAAVGYKRENMTSFKQFIYSLPLLLPCEYCREHLYENLRTIPLTEEALSDNKNLFLWSYMLHDQVNHQLRKQSPVYPIAERFYFEQLGNNNFWGPCMWRAIHSFAAAYQPEVKGAFKQFIYSLPGIIPCNVCRSQLNKILQQLPLGDDYLKDSHNLFLWSYLLHDLVNKNLGKISPPLKDIKAQYFNPKVCQSCGVL